MLQSTICALEPAARRRIGVSRLAAPTLLTTIAGRRNGEIYVWLMAFWRVIPSR